MEGKNVAKISLSTFFLIFAILVIIVMGVFIYKLTNEKNVEAQKLQELQRQINVLNENNTNNIANNANSNALIQDKENIDVESINLYAAGEGINVDVYPIIYTDENGYIYYDSNYGDTNNTSIQYKKICDKNNNAIKVSMIILQTPSTRNAIDPKITCKYVFLTDSGVYQFDYYYSDEEGREVFSKYAEIKYNEVVNDYKFLEVKDQYGGHTINMLLKFDNNNEQKLIDISTAYDVKTKTDLIEDSWHMNLEQE